MNYVIVLIIIFFTSCVGKTDGRESENEYELKLLWFYPYTNESISLSIISGSPTLMNKNSVVIFTDGNLTSLNIESSEENWKYKLPESSPIVSNTIIHDRQAIFIKHDKLNSGVIINKSNGEVIETFTANDIVFFDFINDSFSDNDFYLTGNNRNVFVFSKEGVFEKEIKFDKKITSVSYFKESVISTHTYRDSDRAQHPNNAFGKIISYDLDADSVNWEYDNEYGGYTYAPILLENGIIYAGSTDGINEFTAINAETGEVIWRRLGQESWAYTLGTNAIYINDGTDLVALNKADGRKLWQTSFRGRGFAQSNVAYLDGYVYHSHSGALHVLEAITGEIVHKISISPDGSQFYNLSAGYGKVFVQSDYALYAYKAWEELP
jgi:outer membrane protein assembly factor BamB